MTTRKEYLANKKLVKKNYKSNLKEMQLVDLKEIENRYKHSKSFK